MVQSNSEASKRYRSNLKIRAAAGDKQAIEQLEKNRKNQLFRNAKSFIKNHATIAQAREIRELTLERERELKNTKVDY